MEESIAEVKKVVLVSGPIDPSILKKVMEIYQDIEIKVVALKLLGFDKNKIPKYKPLRKYSEYYKLISVEPINGFPSNSKINKAIKSTGKEEVKRLKKVA